MKLISFDIGIKNMAYCIFVVDPSQSTIVIDDWGIINLMNDTNSTSAKSTTPPKCTCHSKPPNKKTPTKPCTRKATFEKNGMFYCSAHAETSEWILPFDQWKKRKQMSKEDLILLGQSHSAFSTTSPKSTKKECLAYLEEWFLAKLLVPIQKKKEKTAGSMDLITLGRNMTKSLDKMEKAKNSTHVIMENQISTIASRMKTIQGMLAQYYIMDPTQPHIEFISSANKLKHLVTAKPTPEKNTYKQHKLDSIEFCKRFLEINRFAKEGESWISQLNTSKKDDLADCFLQGIWYLKQQKLITCADDLKIKCV